MTIVVTEHLGEYKSIWPQRACDSLMATTLSSSVLMWRDHSSLEAQSCTTELTEGIMTGLFSYYAQYGQSITYQDRLTSMLNVRIHYGQVVASATFSLRCCILLSRYAVCSKTISERSDQLNFSNAFAPGEVFVLTINRWYRPWINLILHSFSCKCFILLAVA